MANEFYALLGRMRYITRWGLMRNSFSENIQEHSHQVAVLAHALALIRRDILGLPSPDPEKCAVAALYHDASEILTGDMPTPIKYYNPEIRTAYKAVEKVHQGRDFFHSLSGGEDACPLRRLFVQEKIFFQAGLDRRADLCII